jgi:SAM-dependent methyltransferase
MHNKISFAQLYDAQYHDFDADLPLWLARAREAGDPVLELGCGSGRVLLPLVQAGHRLAGVDHDSNMLELARRRLSSAGVEQVALIEADLSSFAIEERFKLALAPLNTLATLEDDAFRAALACTADHLLSGADLICDLPNPLTAVEEKPDPDEILDEFIEPSTESAVQVRAAVEPLVDGSVQRVAWVYEVLSREGFVEPIHIEQRFHLRGTARLRELAEQSGLQLAGTLGDYDSSPYTEDSPRLIAIFRRTA